MVIRRRRRDGKRGCYKYCRRKGQRENGGVRWKRQGHGACRSTGGSDEKRGEGLNGERPFRANRGCDRTSPTIRDDEIRIVYSSQTCSRNEEG